MTRTVQPQDYSDNRFIMASDHERKVGHNRFKVCRHGTILRVVSTLSGVVRARNFCPYCHECEGAK